MKRTRRKLLFLAALLAFPLGFLIVGAAFCAVTLHVQRRTGPKPAGAVATQITARDHAALKAWWLRPSLPSAVNHNCVIVLHGITDSRASSSGFAPMFLPLGYSVLAPDSRAHGESSGAVVTYGLLEKYDVIDWVHWLQGQGCRKIYGLGESLGASILIQATSVEPVFSAVVAECPYSNLRRMAEYRIRGLLRPVPYALSNPLAQLSTAAGLYYAAQFEHLDFSQVSTAQSMAASRTPVLLIHGVEDDHTPASESQELFAVRPMNSELWLVPKANHTQASAVAPREFYRRVVGWFGEH